MRVRVIAETAQKLYRSDAEGRVDETTMTATGSEMSTRLLQNGICMPDSVYHKMFCRTSLKLLELKRMCRAGRKSEVDIEFS